MEYLSPFTWISQDPGAWYQQYVYQDDQTGHIVTVQNKKTENSTPRGSLLLTKVVEDPVGTIYNGERFEFEVTYTPDGGSATTETVFLGDGDSRQWLNLQNGSPWTVVEKLTGETYTSRISAESGTIGSTGQVRVTATNTVNVPGTGDLSISKTVRCAEGVAEGDEDTDFLFTVEARTADNAPVTGAFAATTNGGASMPVQFSGEGVARVSLKGGQTLTIRDLPEGARYSVTEESQENYTLVASDGTAGTIPGSAAFTNRKDRDSAHGGFTLTKALSEGTVLDGDVADFEFLFAMANLKPFARYGYAIVTPAAGEARNEAVFLADRNGEARIPWPENASINVTIGRTAKYTDDPGTILPDSFARAYTAQRSAGGAWTLTGEDMTAASEGDVYSFTVRCLPKFGRQGGREVEYTYFVSETRVDGYQPPRYYMGGQQIPGATQVASGGTIVNAMIAVALPETGGPGTTFCTASGLTFVLLALALLLRRKRTY